MNTAVESVARMDLFTAHLMMMCRLCSAQNVS